jgi:competence protein ComEC
VIDGRLLVPTGAAWAAAAGSLVLAGTVADLDQRHGWAVRGLVVVVTLAALLLGLLAEGWRRGRAGDRRVALTAVAVGGALLGSTVACLHVIALTPEGLTAWTRARVTAVVQGVVVTEPVIRSHPGAAVWQRTSRKEIRLATSAIAARGEILAVDVPMLVRVPDDAEVPPPGSVVEVTGRLSPAPAAAQVSATLTTDASQAHLVVVGDPGWIDRWTHAMRSGLREALEGTPPRAGALVAGLAVGDESLQPGDLAEQMRASGLSHLTAVSGGNVSIVVVLVVGIATALGVGLVIRVGAALMALAFFVVLVGPQPSVVRAAAMGGLVLLGLLAGGRRAGPSVLAASVLLLIVLAPGLAASWGLALSAFATGGLVLLAPRVQHWLDTSTITRRWPPAVREALAVTISAQVATLPILVAMGATVGWVSLPANLLAMPVVAPITVLGLLSSLFAPVSLPVAAVLSQAASWPAGWIARVAEVASGLPLASLPWPTGVWGVLLLAGAGLLVVVARAVGRRAYPEGTPTVVGRVAAALTACLVALWVLAPPDRRGWPPEGWFLLMCDVGQGDAILVRSGPQSAIVVDAAPIRCRSTAASTTPESRVSPLSCSPTSMPTMSMD